MKKLVATLLFVTAPIAALSVGPRAAQACWYCKTSRICANDAIEGAYQCTNDPVTLICHVSGSCI